MIREALLPLWRPDVEVCGLVLKDGQVFQIANVHEEPRANFQFSLDDLERFCVSHTYNDVEGIFHTHPSNNPLPSEKDVAGWPAGHELRYWIVTEEHVAEWRRDDDGVTLILPAESPLAPSIHSASERL